jgi:hypothetical protein
MLASITPLGERGRRSRWAVTVTAFAVGALGAGLALGWLLGELGAIVGGSSGGARVRVAAIGVAAALAVAVDLRYARRGRVPGPRRQVDRGWLDAYRGWVYGSGFGAQLGLAVTTVVTSAATYLAVLCAVLSGSAAAGAAVLGSHGAVRGLTPLVAARVDRPERLMALHVRLQALRAPVAVALTAVLALISVAALVWSAA